MNVIIESSLTLDATEERVVWTARVQVINATDDNAAPIEEEETYWRVDEESLAADWIEEQVTKLRARYPEAQR